MAISPCAQWMRIGCALFSPLAPAVEYRTWPMALVPASRANVAAVRLWETLGFETVGIVPEAFDSRTHGLVGLRVMYRRLP